MLSITKPNDKYRPRPLLFLSNKPDKEHMCQLLRKCKEIGYGGVGVISYKDTNIEYLSEEYFTMYEWILKESKELGLKVCLYDEYWFPSGKAGGLLAERYPEAITKRLEMREDLLPLKGSLEYPEDGILMSAVAFNKDTNTLIDVTDEYSTTNTVSWDRDGSWKLLRFYCIKGLRGMVNYLDAEAVNKFIEITHESFYKRFPEYFGDTIDSSFYDEPQFYSQHGKTWTVHFNEEFIKRKGYSPNLLYPALFMDVGENTISYRNELLSVRADLYSEGFPKVIQDWCTKHGISLKGHIDQEEVVNPSGITDDILKSFRYQDIPGIDQIFKPGRARKAYKLVSSAADNWDKSLVMCECYGAMDDLTEELMYAEANDLFAKGVNELIPHAVWYDDKVVKFAPELSWRHPYYGKILPSFNKYVSRVSSVLQNGKHVSRVAILYPIEGLHSQYSFLEDDNLEIDAYYAGGKYTKENDYQDVGEHIFYKANRDYTYLHPDRLTYDYEIKDSKLCLKNNKNINEYSIVILTGQDTISPNTLKVLLDFVKNGGTVVATSILPKYSNKTNDDKTVVSLVEEIFGITEMQNQITKKTHSNGCAISIPFGNLDKLNDILDGVDFDIDFKNHVEGIGYIHKKYDNGDAYYIVNQNYNDVSLSCVLKDYTNDSLSTFNPYTGECNTIEYKQTTIGLEFNISIPSNRSLFIINGTI
ncbi:MAG: hypothetical protein MJ236_02940 [Clostridia bacterium]|nr:hypothetical protein [Clostridia bacterium]